MSVLRRRVPKREQSSRQRRFEDAVLPELDTLYRTALGLTNNREQAEDLVQDTCLRAYRALDQFDGRHCRAWLLTVLRHTYISQWRHDGHGRETIAYMDDLQANNESSLPVGLSAEEEFITHTFAENIEGALACLPEDGRLMLLLAYVEELSYAEIAQVMDCPIGTVMSRLHRARRQLEALLEPKPAETEPSQP